MSLAQETEMCAAVFGRYKAFLAKHKTNGKIGAKIKQKWKNIWKKAKKLANAFQDGKMGLLDVVIIFLI